MRSTVLVAIALTAGCTPARTPTPDASSLPPDDCPTHTLALGAFGPVEGLLGQPAQVDFGLELFDCHLAVPSVMPQVHAAVLDPDGKPIPFTVTVGPGDPNAHDWHSLPRDVESGFAELISATLTFTPTRPGAYHLAVRFEPGFGTAQSDLVVLADRRPAAFQSISMPYVCNTVEVVGGVVLCLDFDHWLLHVFANGVETGAITALAFAAEDGRLWWIERGFMTDTVHLGELSDAGQLTELASLNLDGQPIARGFGVALAPLSGTGDRLMLSSAGLIEELAYVDGGLLPGPVVTLPTDGYACVVYRPDAGVIFSSELHDAGLIFPRVCRLHDTSGAATCQAATKLSCDGHVLWTLDQEVITAWTVAPDGGVTRRPGFLGQVDLIQGDAPYRRAPPLGVELVDLDPLPALTVYGLPPDAPTDGGDALYRNATSRIYWEWNGAQLDYLVRSSAN